MKALFPVIINLTAVVLGRLMMTFRNERADTQTQGEAVKTDMPCPDGVSG
jgi:hypothetical protein